MANGLLYFFEEGGPVMVPTLVSGFGAVTLAVQYALRPERRRLPPVVAGAVLTLLGGLTGTVMGVVATLHYVNRAVPAEVPVLVMLGLGESLQNMVLALLLTAVTALATVVATWRHSRQEPA